jgi:hypothetical protein
MILYPSIVENKHFDKIMKAFNVINLEKGNMEKT